MNTEETDVLIVGGGPIGSYLACLLSPHLEVLVAEKTDIGRPVRCAGQLGVKVFEEFGVSKKSVINKINGADFRYKPLKDGIKFRIRRDIPQAFVVDREAFDKEIADKARKNGARYLLKTEYLGHQGNEAVLRSGSEKIAIGFKYLVGADGVFSKVSEEINSDLSGEILSGPQIEVPFSGPDDLVTVLVDREITDFFVWIIPTSRGSARVGTLNGDIEDLLTVTRKLPPLKDKILCRGGGAVPIGTKKVRKGNIFLVGDAASQVKPLTAGGIYYGLKGASYLSEAILNGKPEVYEDKWERWRSEIKTSMRYRKIYQNIPESLLKLVFKGFSKPSVIEVIEKEADYRKHSLILKKILPKMLGFG